MKNKITVTSSVAGLLALLILLFGVHMAPLSHHPRVTDLLFFGGFALAFLATLLAATSLPGHWRRGGVVRRFIWCFTVMASFAGLLAFGP